LSDKNIFWHIVVSRKYKLCIVAYFLAPPHIRNLYKPFCALILKSILFLNYHLACRQISANVYSNFSTVTFLVRVI